MKKCRKCGVELTNENWFPSFKKRGVGRCKACHQKLADDWNKRNPLDARQRTERWRKRNPEYRPKYYQSHTKEYSERARRRLWKYKTEVINRLGGRCVSCGMSDMRVLQINHINGGGQKENLFGGDMYMAILKGKRHVNDLDVRCANCNIIYEYESGRRKLPIMATH